MAVFTHIAAIAIALNVLLGIYTLRANPRSMVNRIFALLSLTQAFWALGYIFQLTAANPQEAWFWIRATSFSGIFGPLLLAHFLLLVSRRQLGPRLRWMIIALYVTACVFLVKATTGYLFSHDVVRTEYGWDGVVPIVPWSVAFISYVLALIASALVIMVRWFFRASAGREKKQAQIMLWCAVPTLLLIFMSEIVMRVLDIHNLPGLAPVLLPIWCVGMAYAVVRYGLLRVDPAKAADEILATMSDGVLLLSVDGVVLEANRAALSLFESEGGQVVGANVETLFPDEPFFERDLESQLAAGPVLSAPVNLHYKGQSRPLNVSASPVTDEFGHRAGAIVIVRDVTELKGLEEGLAQAMKMDAIGRLAGGIAHDFNNLLAVMRTESQLLLEELPDDGEAREGAKAIEHATFHAETLTAQLLGFARRQSRQSVSLDLNHLVTQTAALLDRTLGKEISIELDLQAERASVLGDIGQLEQVFVNLALNAKDAMPEGGQLLWRTRTVEDEDKLPESGHELQRPYVELVAKDTGSGIPDSQLHRVFEPFFTTKEASRGTGMGLATAYGIIRDHHGEIYVSSSVGEGTTFTIRLPLTLSSDAKEARESPQPQRPLEKSSGSVLVIDDDAMVRRSTQRLLWQQGYDVYTASDGHEGIEVYREHLKEIDLVLLDVIMPEMGGVECFRELRRLKSDVRIIMISGYSQFGTEDQLLDEGALGFVSKPFDNANLLENISKALRGSG